MNPPSSVPGPTRLTDVLIKALSDRLDRKLYRPGERLPSERALCQEFNVSRTVVREAVASMRLSGRLISRPGLGLYVAQEADAPVDFVVPPAADERWALHIMELRLAIEVQAAGLAAERRTPQDLADIVQAFDAFAVSGADMATAIEADLAFHTAIARASHNPHFVQILATATQDMLLELKIKHGSERKPAARAEYAKRTTREHAAIMTAITRRDTGAARTAMARHLGDSIARYRKRLARS
ncbi:FadR/GntR family transcriptional regulator [Orrella sp. JC864]|uniref:FadR/GntR family transcriptional regulator n=1 Tax=Orrella sp. JC864 TaxID=3120298 RepID=UPI00300A8EEA